MAKPSKEELLDFWKENIARDRKAEHYDLTEKSEWVEINVKLDRTVIDLEAADKEDEIRPILRRIFLPKAGLIWARAPYLFFKLLREGDLGDLREVKHIIVDTRKSSEFNEEWVANLYNLVEKKYPEGTKRFKAAKAILFNVLGELFGKLHFKDNPIKNSCSERILRKMGYDFDKTKYESFKEAFERFKEFYGGYIGKLSPDSIAMNVEIDQFFNFFDKDKSASAFLRTGRVLPVPRKPVMDYFILITGGGEYKDEPEKRYHFKKGIPGSKQLVNAANKGGFVYYEKGKFYAKGELGEITSYEENDITYYYAEVKNFEEMKPIDFSEVRNDLSFGYVGQAGIRRISEEDYNTIIRGAREIGVEEGKYAILWSANIGLYPGVIEYHQEHIRRVGATYWGVGFSIDMARFALPINGYLYTTDSRKVTHVAKIEGIETYNKKQLPKEQRLRPPEYKNEVHRTYFRISELKRLPVPIEIHKFQQWNGKNIVRPPQNYVLVIELPILTQPLNLQPPLIKIKLMLDENILGQVCANLNSGSHIIITGPVGTGKTSLTEDICRAAKESKFCDGYVLTTASSDWTTFDTIGGYMPTEEGKLRFEQGKFLEAIRENEWLIIDEINRADIDKAFGQLFTVLSGQRVELPFKHSNGKTISIGATTEDRSYFDDSDAEYKVGRNWRIIATMNVYDMNFLFEMSYAFMRRFAFVYLDVPEKFEELIDGWCREKRISGKTEEKLKELAKLTERKMGPAIIKDIVEYLEFRGDGERELAEAIIAYILPQLQGLEKDKIEKTWDQIAMIFDEKNVPNTVIRPVLKEVVGIELREILE
jgi:hypothetical protein